LGSGYLIFLIACFISSLPVSKSVITIFAIY
jgi:hypothetical protein